MADQVEEVKDKLDIVQFISEYVPLKKAGRNWKALCPFHSEKTPSFMVNPERGIFKCFGCGKGGDGFSFLMEMEGVEFPEALRILAKRTGVKIRQYVPDGRDQQRERLYALNSLTSKFYAYLLDKHKVGLKARRYLKERKISPQAIELFKLGYAPKSWDSLLRYLKKKGFSEEEGEKAGLLVRSEKGRGYYDRFRGRVIFPLIDHRGNVRGFAGRLLDPEAREAKYINTPETPVYVKRELLYGLDLAKEAIRRARQAIVVEGETDMISSYLAGVENVVAIKGSALTEEQVRLLKRYADELLLALDADFAGDEAAKRGIELADQAGLTVKVVKIPIGKDPDECVRQNPEAWKQAVQAGIAVYDFVIEAAMDRYGTETAQAKKKVGDEVLPILAKISDPIVQAHYRQVLAGLLGMDENDLLAAMRKLAPETRPIKQRSLAVKEPKAKKTRRQRLEEHLLSLIIQGLQIKDEWPRGVPPLTTPVLVRIWDELKKYLKNRKKFVYAKFVKKLPPELVEAADRLSLVNLEGLVDDRVRWVAEMKITTNELKLITLKAEVEKIALELEKTQDKTKEKKLASYTKRIARLSKALDR